MKSCRVWTLPNANPQLRATDEPHPPSPSRANARCAVRQGTYIYTKKRRKQTTCNTHPEANFADPISTTSTGSPSPKTPSYKELHRKRGTGTRECGWGWLFLFCCRCPAGRHWIRPWLELTNASVASWGTQRSGHLHLPPHLHP